jgi:hypothetical protein
MEAFAVTSKRKVPSQSTNYSSPEPVMKWQKTNEFPSDEHLMKSSFSEEIPQNLEKTQMTLIKKERKYCLLQKSQKSSLIWFLILVVLGFVEWPPRSPDLNPMESIWTLLQNELYRGQKVSIVYNKFMTEKPISKK